jgi:hypothetical protein
MGVMRIVFHRFLRPKLVFVLNAAILAFAIFLVTSAERNSPLEPETMNRMPRESWFATLIWRLRSCHSNRSFWALAQAAAP